MNKSTQLQSSRERVERNTTRSLIIYFCHNKHFKLIQI